MLIGYWKVDNEMGYVNRIGRNGWGMVKDVKEGWMDDVGCVNGWSMGWEYCNFNVYIMYA